MTLEQISEVIAEWFSASEEGIALEVLGLSMRLLGQKDQYDSSEGPATRKHLLSLLKSEIGTVASTCLKRSLEQQEELPSDVFDMLTGALGKVITKSLKNTSDEEIWNLWKQVIAAQKIYTPVINKIIQYETETKNFFNTTINDETSDAKKDLLVRGKRRSLAALNNLRTVAENKRDGCEVIMTIPFFSLEKFVPLFIGIGLDQYNRTLPSPSHLINELLWTILLAVYLFMVMYFIGQIIYNRSINKLYLGKMQEDLKDAVIKHVAKRYHPETKQNYEEKNHATQMPLPPLPQLKSVPSTSESPVLTDDIPAVPKQPKKKTRGVANDIPADNKAAETEMEKPLGLIRLRDRLGTERNSWLDLAKIDTVVEDESLRKKFKDAVQDGKLLGAKSRNQAGIKPCLFFKCRNNAVEKGYPYKIKISGAPRLFCRLILDENDGTRIISPDYCDLNPHQGKRSRHYGG